MNSEEKEKIDVRWFCGRTNVGIVQVTNEEGTSYFINAVSGLDMSKDIQFIRDYGSKFPKKAGDTLFLL